MIGAFPHSSDRCSLLLESYLLGASPDCRVFEARTNLDSWVQAVVGDARRILQGNVDSLAEYGEIVRESYEPGR